MLNQFAIEPSHKIVPSSQSCEDHVEIYEQCDRPLPNKSNADAIDCLLEHLALSDQISNNLINNYLLQNAL